MNFKETKFEKYILKNNIKICIQIEFKMLVKNKVINIVEGFF